MGSRQQLEAELELIEIEQEQRKRQQQPQQDSRPDVAAELRPAMEAKQAKQQENIERGEAQRATIAQNLTEAAVDAGKYFPQGMALGFADEIFGGIESLGGAKSYKQARDEYRDFYNELQERSPVATFVSDIIAPNPLKMLKGTKFIENPYIRSALTGSAVGAGHTEKEEFGDQVGDALATGAIGLGVTAVGKVGQKAFDQPELMEAQRLGLAAKTVKEKFKSIPEQLDKVKQTMTRFRDMGLFGGRRMRYNAKTFKFERDPKAGKLEHVGSPDIEQVSKSLQNTIEESSKEVERILTRRSPQLQEGELLPSTTTKTRNKTFIESDPYVGVKKVKRPVTKSTTTPAAPREEIYTPEDIKERYDNELMGMLDEVEEKYGFKARKKISKVIEDSMDHVAGEHQTGANLLTLQREKQRLYADLDTAYNAQNVPPVEVATKMKLANLYKRIIEEDGGEAIAKHNQVMEDAFLLKNDLVAKITGAGVSATEQVLAVYGSGPFIATKFMGSLADPTRLGRAKVGRSAKKAEQFMNKYWPELLQPSGEEIAPKIMSQSDMYDQKKPFTPMSSQNGRSPDSIAEELIRTPLPRNAEEWLANPDFIRAKIAAHSSITAMGADEEGQSQEVLQMYDSANDVMQHNPEDLPKFLETLVHAVPHLFASDEYDRVNGKITTPIGRERATKRTMEKESLTPTEKILKIHHMNRTMEFEE